MQNLLPTILAVALLTVGCATADPGARTEPVPDVLRPARSVGSAPPRSAAPATIRKLNPALRDALTRATYDARADGVTLVVNSGWRSRAHQLRLFDEAVARYGSADEARRYVSSPDRSAHVTGDAVDIGPTDAAEWLRRHGSTYGLCQVFANEIWHYELATTPGGQCPEMLPDSSYRG